MVFGLGVWLCVQGDLLPDGANGDLRDGSSGEANDDLLRMAAESSPEAAADDKDEQTEFNGENAGEKIDFLCGQLHQAESGERGFTGEGLPGRPRAPGIENDGTAGKHQERPDEPGPAGRGWKCATGEFDDHQQADEGGHNREPQENTALSHGGEPAIKHAAGEQAQRREDDAEGEPGKAAGAIAAEQDDEQDERSCKGERPKDLDGRKIEVEMHLNLVRQRKCWRRPLLQVYRAKLAADRWLT